MIDAFTMSYDASVKCKKQDVKGLIHHNAREVDMQNGVNLNHSNECIDIDRTMNRKQNTYCYKPARKMWHSYSLLLT